MKGETWIYIGSGKAESKGAGNKSALLDKSARAGIHVPRGIVVLDTAWDQAVLTGLMSIEGERASIPDAERFLKYFQLPSFDKPLAVRSAFSSEDGNQTSLAGHFESVLNVNGRDKRALANAIARVVASASRFPSESMYFRRDILIMEMVEAEVSGVAFTEREHEDDLINFTEGTAQDLVGGKIQGKTMPLAKLRNWESKIPGEKLEGWQQRLQKLLRTVRRWIGGQDWDVEWADDGETCYLVQLRPVTRPTRRNEAFTIANHKEILPELPSRFMTSIIESCAKDLFAYYRSFDSTLPKSRAFIEVFYGRPYINLSLMSEMMRMFGLPTRLVTDNIGGQTDRVYGLNLSRMLRKIARLTLPRMAYAQMRAVKSVQERTLDMRHRIQHSGDSYNDLIKQMRWLYTTLVTEMFSLTAAMGPLLVLLRRANTLEQHSAGQQTIASKMYDDLAPLRQYVAGNAHIIPDLDAGFLPEDEGFTELWENYITQYGHRGIFESDIARPRYTENPAPLLQSLTQPTGRRLPPPEPTWRSYLTLPLWWQAGRAMRAREQWRHDVMRAFMHIRKCLLEKAEAEVARGALPEVDAIWKLSLDEVRNLDEGWIPPADFFERRDAEIERLKQYHLPDLFHRNDNLELYRDGLGPELLADHVTGISLTTGRISGRAWVLAEPDTHLPKGFNPDETILIARSVDAGWIPTFARVAGVVVETGGDLSHGSIILRELGLPAITNAHQATRQFKTGDMVYLDAGSGLAEREPSDDDTAAETQTPESDEVMPPPEQA